MPKRRRNAKITKVSTTTPTVRLANGLTGHYIGRAAGMIGGASNAILDFADYSCIVVASYAAECLLHAEETAPSDEASASD